MTAPLRIAVAASGWPGHVFPALALAKALRRRGHEILVQSDERWRATISAQRLRFAEIPPYSFLGFPPTEPHHLSVPEAARALLAELRSFSPDVVVADVFTVAPALAAELAGIRHATLIPYHYPVNQSGLPFFLGMPVDPVGFAPPRTPLGAAAWRALRPLHESALRRERDALDGARTELDLPPRGRFHPAISERLALVASFPQLEYPRPWAKHVHVTGPMLFDIAEDETAVPPGEGPLVLVASSTLHDRGLRLLRTVLAALGSEPVRVLAAINERGRSFDGQVPSNATVLDWVSYADVMPRASLVVCHGGHGTIARALSDGVPVLVCPVWGDQAENGARVAWAGAGLMIPRRLLVSAAVRLAARRLLDEPRYAAAARRLGEWARENDGAERGARLVEAYAGSATTSAGGGALR